MRVAGRMGWLSPAARVAFGQVQAGRPALWLRVCVAPRLRDTANTAIAIAPDAPGLPARSTTRTIAGLELTRRRIALRGALLGESRLDIFLQQVINGLTLGSVYA